MQWSEIVERGWLSKVRIWTMVGVKWLVRMVYLRSGVEDAIFMGESTGYFLF